MRGEGGDRFVDAFLCATGNVSAVGLQDTFLDLEFLFCRFCWFTGFVGVGFVGGRFTKTTGKESCVTRFLRGCCGIWLVWR